jgi:hypothetical protein
LHVFLLLISPDYRSSVDSAEIQPEWNFER